MSFSTLKIFSFVANKIVVPMEITNTIQAIGNIDLHEQCLLLHIHLNKIVIHVVCL